MRLPRLFAIATLATLMPALVSHAADNAAPTLTLTANASRDVANDWLAIDFSTTIQGKDAGIVQKELQTALDAALTLARKNSGEGLEIHTGNFSLSPRIDEHGRANGWNGSTELVIEGRDTGRIAALAGNITTLSVAGTRWSVSRQLREKTEAELAGNAIRSFREKAANAARDFGFTAYQVHEVTLQEGGGVRPPMALMATRGAMMPDALPNAAGTSEITVSVNGSVILTDTPAH